MVIQTWLFGRHFLKKELHGKQLPVFFFQKKFKLSSENKNFGKHVCYHETDKFPYSKDFDEISSDINVLFSPAFLRDN